MKLIFSAWLELFSQTYSGKMIEPSIVFPNLVLISWHYTGICLGVWTLLKTIQYRTHHNKRGSPCLHRVLECQVSRLLRAHQTARIVSKHWSLGARSTVTMQVTRLFACDIFHITGINFYHQFFSLGYNIYINTVYIYINTVYIYIQYIYT